MPESCSSIGAATVRESVSALAPGSVAVIVTVGGAISGYCAIGRTCEATRPASVKMIEMTDAKIGRSMKNFENTARERLVRLRRRSGAVGLRADRHAGPQLEEVVEHDALAGLQAGEQIGRAHV